MNKYVICLQRFFQALNFILDPFALTEKYVTNDVMVAMVTKQQAVVSFCEAASRRLPWKL